MNEIFLDTETTGLSFNEGHKVVEIACIETKDLIPTNRVYHKFISPKRSMPAEAFKIHGFSDQFLSDKETFDQIALMAEIIGEDKVPYLQEGMTVVIESYEEEPIGVQLPDHVILNIVEADAVVKGQTATSSYKPAILDNGIRIMVPPHIEVGTRVVVSTIDNTYVERAKG